MEDVSNLIQYMNRDDLDALIYSIKEYIKDNSGVYTVDHQSDLPTLGKSHNAVYIARKDRKIFVWDDDDMKYNPVNLGIEDSILNGGDATK